MGLKSNKEFSSKDIAQYYDVSEDHYMYFWDLNKSHSLHYGYWDATTKNFREALANINEVLAQKAHVNAGVHVLDAGCGVGGSTTWLAKNKQATVVGITLSNKQAKRGNNRIQDLGLGNHARIDVQDYTQTNFPSESFDVVWAIESVCHAQDKNSFIREAYRLLKPGGRLILADFFIDREGNEKDQAEIDRWAHGWAVPFFEKKDVFFSMLESNGFKWIEMEDCTKNILPSAKRLYYAFFPGWLLSKLYNLFNRNTTEFSKKNVYTAFYQYKTVKKGLWKYYIVCAQK